MLGAIDLDGWLGRAPLLAIAFPEVLAFSLIDPCLHFLLHVAVKGPEAVVSVLFICKTILGQTENIRRIEYNWSLLVGAVRVKQILPRLRDVVFNGTWGDAGHFTTEAVATRQIC